MDSCDAVTATLGFSDTVWFPDDLSHGSFRAWLVLGVAAGDRLPYPEGRRSSCDTLQLLSESIRFDTTNPPGNERPLAELLVGALEGDGIEAE